MTLSDLKTFFRTRIKVVPGGPPVGTPGANRAAGVLAVLDKLAEFAEAQAAEFLTGTYTVQAADLPEPQITVANAALFSSVGIEGTNGNLKPLAYGSGYTSSSNVLTILAAAAAQAGEVVHYSYLAGSVSAGYTAGAGIDITGNVISATSAALVSQHTTFSSGRFTGPIQFVNRRPAGLSVQIISNVALLFAQVNYQDLTNPGTWLPGTTHASAGNSPADLAALLADVEADIAAVPVPALAVGVEVLFRTYPLDNALEADFLLTGFNSATYFGRALAFRVASSGVPLGNLVSNSQFVDGSGWTMPVGGITLGNGQAAFSVTNAYFYQVVTSQADDYELRVRILNIDAGGYVMIGAGLPQGGGYYSQQYYSVPGDYVQAFNWPSTQPLQFTVQASAGSVLAYYYCVPK